MSNQDLDQLLGLIGKIEKGEHPYDIINSLSFLLIETKIQLDDFHPVLTNTLLTNKEFLQARLQNKNTTIPGRDWSFEYIRTFIFSLYSKRPKENHPEQFKKIITQFLKMPFYDLDNFGISKVLAEVDSTDKTQMQLLNNIITTLLEAEWPYSYKILYFMQIIDYTHRVSIFEDYGPQHESIYNFELLLEGFEVSDLSNLVLIYDGYKFGKIARNILREKTKQ